MQGEFTLIARFFAGLDQGSGVELGVGDDAALLNLAPRESLAVSVDTLVEGTHFPRGGAAQDIAYRAVAAAASDLAAMGARPLAMTLALTLPAADEQWLLGCRRGLADAVADFSLPLIGGDLTKGPLSLSVQVMGGVESAQALRRDGARPGDALYVSGPVGAAAAGLAVLQGDLDASASNRDTLLSAFWRPQPALALGQSLCGIASAAIDVSDGLLADLGHLAEASGVGVTVDSGQVPLPAVVTMAVSRNQALNWGLSGGEDYVLCFTLPPGAQTPHGCVRIGEVHEGAGVSCDFEVQHGGFEHF